MNKKENRMAVRQTVEKAVIRDEQNRRIQSAATNPVKEVLKILHTTLRGLEADTVSVNRSKYGTNKVTHEKKKSLAKRVAGAFINPFTAILFCLAFVSTITDMIFPYFSLFGSVPEDFDFLTVVIILTMVFISGTLRFVQESRSGNAAEKLLAMITTTCTVTRIGQEKTEIPMDDLVVGDIVHLSAGDIVRRTFRGIEHLHQYAGTSCHCHVFGSHWCHPEHRSGPAVYLHFQYGSKGSCTRHHPVTGMQRNLGNILSYFEKSFLATGTQVHEIT